jgi:CubicO group peptidase (beta-lactamase class C family)
LLFLNRGRWNGQQLINPAWIDEATTNQVPTSLSAGASFDLRGRFGYGWWTNGIDISGNRPWPSAPHRTYTFYGGGRNFCMIVPEWNMVIARMSPPTESAQPDDTVWDGFFNRLGNGIQ